MNVKFDFEDINLIANKSIVKSQKECDTSVKLNGFTFKIPVIPTNMSAVINENLCVWLAKNGYFYIMHRFNIDQIKFIKSMHDQKLYVSISIGIKKRRSSIT